MNFIAGPPRRLGQGSLYGGAISQVGALLGEFWHILWRSIVPFNPGPELFDDPPRPDAELDDVQLKRCETYFTQVEATRDALEAKARATFSVVAFLAPLIASAFVFFITRPLPGSAARDIAIGVALLSFVLLVLGFLSITRAVAVRPRQTLGYKSIVDTERGEFRRYNKAFHARGLLWCASSNEAMNVHLAEFVKGAHILTALAVFALVVAAVPAPFFLSAQPTTNKTEIVGPVNIVSPALVEVQKEVSFLAKGVAKVREQHVDIALAEVQADLAELIKQVAEFPNNAARDQRLIALESKLDQLADSLREFRAEVQRQRSGSAAGPARNP